MNLLLHAEYWNPTGYVRFWLGETIFPISALNPNWTADNGMGVTFNSVGGFARWVRAVAQGQPPIVQPMPDPDFVMILIGNSDDFKLISFAIPRDALSDITTRLNGLVLDVFQAQKVIKVYAN